MRSATAAIALCAASIVALAGASSGAAERRVALLPLSPATTYVPYTLSPGGNDLAAMTARLRGGLEDQSVRLVAPAAVAAALAAHGRDQRSSDRACDEADCARAIGRAVGADVVVYGDVSRAMAVVWGTHVYAVDVRNGRVVGDLQAGYKGDETTMLLGERHLGACLMRMVTGRPRCTPDRGY